ncbi:MAG: type II/IV secretion system protein [Myxococcales bacterium]|nr:type II/IV secretion system protein [Myxococcales bacterium]
METTSGQLIEAAVAGHLVDQQTVDQLRAVARRRRSDLLEEVVNHARVPVAAIYRAYAEQRGMAFVDPMTSTIDGELLSGLPETLLRRRHVLPVARENGHVLVATSHPDDRQTLATVERSLGVPVRVAVAEPEALLRSLDHALRLVKRDGSPAVSLEEPNAVGLLDQILKEAFLRHASDVHLEPQEKGMRVRLRVDGRLQEYMRGLREVEAVSLVTRVKVLAGLNIAEHRAPQDGGYRHPRPDGVEGGIDIRVATVPTRWGEKATLRLLGTDAAALTLERLGMLPGDLAAFRRAIQRPHGIILLTGPTGSGKTTTLYGALREIIRPDVNVMTVENPIEYVIDGISQIQVGGSDKVTFASALRSLLRHDPDVLMVGEIRDRETAETAMQASMTGHLVFSTLHTNNACSAVTRLADLGCERYMVASTLEAAVAQRLVRRLCDRCKLARTATEEEAALLKVGDGWDGTVCDPVGCARCFGVGFRGRIGLFEPLWVDDPIRHLISAAATERELAAQAGDALKTLGRDGLEKVRMGLTTLDEVKQVTSVEI